MTQLSQEEGNLLRILVATDNHLGVWENDPVRKDDSFRTFEEIFEIAKQHRADMVLLGGDLFHDSKPSRSTIVKAIDILSRHCLNENPVSFEILSDQSQNFTTGRVNFENPNYNIGLPVFTIHGNHDDPGGSDNLSAVDILATGSLVNYFGKIVIGGDSGPGKLRISPVLLRKGNTKLALYGLGNLRDERLGNMFRTPNCVEWIRPASTEAFQLEDWINVFVLHQNRIAHTQSAKNYVQEAHLAKFLDLVIWGHEHECIPTPWTTASEGNFDVMQPGSSVATALSEGESKPKHVHLLEICDMSYRIQSIRLETVRPFMWDSVSLRAQRGLDPEDPKSLEDFLNRKVTSMISEATRQVDTKTPRLPLIRLRVDYTGFSTINTQQFGQRFVNKVANPHDVVLWQKSSSRVKPRSTASDARMRERLNLRSSLPDEQIGVEELISNHLDQNLEVIPEEELTMALKEFVQKDERAALQQIVGRVLMETQEATEEQRKAASATAAAAGRSEGTRSSMLDGVVDHRADLDASAKGIKELHSITDVELEGKKGERLLSMMVKEVAQQRRAELAAKHAEAEAKNARLEEGEEGRLESSMALNEDATGRQRHEQQAMVENGREPTTASKRLLNGQRGLQSSDNIEAPKTSPRRSRRYVETEATPMEASPSVVATGGIRSPIEVSSDGSGHRDLDAGRVEPSRTRKRTVGGVMVDERSAYKGDGIADEIIDASEDESEFARPSKRPQRAKEERRAKEHSSTTQKPDGSAIPYARHVSRTRSTRQNFLDSSDEEGERPDQETSIRTTAGVSRTQTTTQGPVGRSQGPLRRLGTSQRLGAISANRKKNKK